MLHTWSCDIKDGMCGFRLYWRGIKPVWIKTPVQYAADGVSHFNAFADNVRIGKMHTRLFLGMLRRRLGGIFGKT